jgi:hypothetical protein
MNGSAGRRGPAPHVLLALVLTVAAPGCGGCGEEQVTRAPPRPRPSAAPIDELAEGELPEGNATAFGLPLPASMTIESRSDLRVIARGRASLESVANFVRERVEAKEIVTGPGKTIFDDIKVMSPRKATPALPRAAGAPEMPAGDAPTMIEKLRVDVSRDADVTRLVVTRHLTPKAPVGLSEDERWRRLGLTRDGKPADPKKFE